MKPISRHIAYYLRKVAQLGSHRPHHDDLPAWYNGRHERLIAYKAEMHKRIKLGN